MGFYAKKAEDVIGGAGRLMFQDDYASNTYPTKIADVISTTDPYPAMSANGWYDFGQTDGGITITRAVDVTTWDTDQFTEVDERVDRWTHTLATSLVEQTAELLKLAWQGGALADVADGLEGERYAPFGTPTKMTLRRIACLFKDKNDKFWMWAFRKSRLNSFGDMVYGRSDKLVTPVTFKLYPDLSIADMDDNVYRIFTNAASPDSWPT